MTSAPALHIRRSDDADHAELQAEREAARAEVIARRKRELLGERDALHW